MDLLQRRYQKNAQKILFLFTILYTECVMYIGKVPVLLGSPNRTECLGIDSLLRAGEGR